MKQEFSLAQLTVLNASPPELAAIAAETGYDTFSMRQIYMGLPEELNFDLSKNKAMLEETKAIMRDTGIRLLDIELARITDEIDPIVYEPAFAIAVELGGKHVLSSIWTQNRDLYVERFARLCDLAASYGLTVDLEYVPVAGVRTLAQAVNVLQQVNRTNAGLMIDIHHFHRAEDKLEDLRRVPRDWFHFMHLCDASGEIPSDFEEMRRIMREDRDYVGEGGINVKAILNTLPAMPYSIELPKNSVSAEFGYKEHARRCIHSAKTYLGIKD